MSFIDHNDPFIDRLVRSKGEDEKVVDREVWRILKQIRWQRVRQPWIDLARTIPQAAKLLWKTWCEIPFFAKEKTDGPYRTPVAQGNGGANPSPGAGAGAVGGASPLYAGLSAATRAAVQAGVGTFRTAGSGAGVAQLSPSNPVPTPTLPRDLGLKIVDAGITAGEIVAYRCWILDSDGLLHSIFRDDVVWQPDSPMEGDVDTDEGVHAFKDRLAAGSYGYRPHSGMVIVSGMVDLWGVVIEHERGYRAQFAAIKSIDDSPFYDAKAIRRRYGLTKRRRKLDKPAKEV